MIYLSLERRLSAVPIVIAGQGSRSDKDGENHWFIEFGNRQRSNWSRTDRCAPTPFAMVPCALKLCSMGWQRRAIGVRVAIEATDDPVERPRVILTEQLQLFSDVTPINNGAGIQQDQLKGIGRRRHAKGWPEEARQEYRVEPVRIDALIAEDFAKWNARQATQRNACSVLATFGAEPKTGYVRGKVLQILNAAFLDIFRRKCLDRNRHRLKVFFAPPRRDNYGVGVGTGFCSRLLILLDLRQGRCGLHKSRSRNSNKKWFCKPHDMSP